VKTPRVLAIETATAWGSVAVVAPEGVLGERRAHVPGGHLEWVIPAVDEVLTAARLTPSAVDALAVSIGPGGFSGLRIGLATAAAWAHALGRPLVALSTLEVIAAGVPGAGLVLAALDARRGEVAAALFRRDGQVRRIAGDLLLAPGDLGSRLGPLAEPVVVAGDALAVHRAALLEALGLGASIAPEELWWPRAAGVGRLGLARLLRGERDDPVGLTPRYARRAVAREYRR
jgi:tRNA threonylcarbamoyladenosine biosynthesis protein TsaB